MAWKFRAVTYWFLRSTLRNRKYVSSRPRYQAYSAASETPIHFDHRLYVRGNGGRICFRAEAWKATICDTPAFWRRRGDRVARVCRSSDGRANEAIVADNGGGESKSRTRMKLATSGIRLGMSANSTSGDWLAGTRPAEIGR